MVRVWWKPLVTLIWLGGLVMMAGARGVAARPPPARRRAGPPPGSRGQAGSDRRMSATLRALLAALLLSLAAAGPALAVQPGRDAGRSGAGGARAGAVRANCAAWSARTSRSTIPTPTSRTTCACWCASAHGRRQRRAGDRLHRLALRRVRAAEAALQSAQRAAVGRRCCCCWPAAPSSCLARGASGPQRRRCRPTKSRRWRRFCAIESPCFHRAGLITPCTSFPVTFPPLPDNLAAPRCGTNSWNFPL